MAKSQAKADLQRLAQLKAVLGLDRLEKEIAGLQNEVRALRTENESLKCSGGTASSGLSIYPLQDATNSPRGKTKHRPMDNNNPIGLTIGADDVGYHQMQRVGMPDAAMLHKMREVENTEFQSSSDVKSSNSSLSQSTAASALKMLDSTVFSPPPTKVRRKRVRRPSGDKTNSPPQVRRRDQAEHRPLANSSRSQRSSLLLEIQTKANCLRKVDRDAETSTLASDDRCGRSMLSALNAAMEKRRNSINSVCSVSTKAGTVHDGLELESEDSSSDDDWE